MSIFGQDILILSIIIKLGLLFLFFFFNSKYFLPPWLVGTLDWPFIIVLEKPLSPKAEMGNEALAEPLIHPKPQT